MDKASASPLVSANFTMGLVATEQDTSQEGLAEALSPYLPNSDNGVSTNQEPA